MIQKHVPQLSCLRILRYMTLLIPIASLPYRRIYTYPHESRIHIARVDLIHQIGSVHTTALRHHIHSVPYEQFEVRKSSLNSEIALLYLYSISTGDMKNPGIRIPVEAAVEGGGFVKKGFEGMYVEWRCGRT